MQELDDIALLREYAGRGSEEAFATLVTRHIDRVYSVALRQTNNPHQAEEITQAVFVILAQKSKQLRPGVILEGWLYQTARLTALTHIRGEIRRARREQEAYMQNALDENPPEVWAQITPLLDAALAGLNETDRNAVVLRFFYGKSMGEIGTVLRANEDTARMRVNRAIEKLRKYFSKHGVDSTTAILAETISIHSVHAAPAMLAKTVTSIAFAKGATASTSTLTLIKGALKLMAWTKAQTVAVGVGVLLIVGTGTVVVKDNFFRGEPSYQGRRLSEWLLDIDNHQPQAKRLKAANAIRNMGTKTLPFLVADLTRAKADKKPIGNRYGEVVSAFEALGPIGKPAIPALVKLQEQNPGYVPGAIAGIGPDALPELMNALTNGSFWVRDNTAAYLANAIYSRKITADEASAAFPVAIDNLQYDSTNILFRDNTRWRAAGLLDALRLNPEISVPALIKAMDDTNFSVAAECALALGSFGNQATSAIPVLTMASSSTNNLLSRSASRSLKLIQRRR